MSEEFEDMFDAVQEAANQKSLNSEQIKTPRQKKTKPEEPQDYIPWTRNEDIIATMQSRTYKATYTRADYTRDKRIIHKAMYKHGNITINDCKYLDKFYPTLAMQALILSRTKQGLPIDIDAFLEAVLVEWLSKCMDKPDEYVSDLLEAIENEKCMSGTLLRLNLNAIAEPKYDNITIDTSFQENTDIHPRWKQPKTQPIRLVQQPRKEVFTGKLRKQMRQFLKDQQAFTSDIDVIYNGLKRNHETYTYEQSLLSWMGYLVIRTIAEKSDNIKIKNHSILVHKKSFPDNH